MLQINEYMPKKGIWDQLFGRHLYMDVDHGYNHENLLLQVMRPHFL